MNHLFSLAFIGIYGAAIIQLSFLVFSDVLDDGVLTYVAVGIGLLENQMGSNLDFRHQTHVATL